MRIDLSESGRFIQVFPARSTNGYCIIQKYEEAMGKSRPLGGIKIPVVDLSRTCVAMMLANGITAAEIIAELFGQIHDVDPEILEFCMRR